MYDNFVISIWTYNLQLPALFKIYIPKWLEDSWVPKGQQNALVIGWVSCILVKDILPQMCNKDRQADRCMWGAPQIQGSQVQSTHENSNIK